jgi:hypothetical protein
MVSRQSRTIRNSLPLAPMSRIIWRGWCNGDLYEAIASVTRARSMWIIEISSYQPDATPNASAKGVAVFLKRVQIIATWLAHTENSLGMVMINDAARH